MKSLIKVFILSNEPWSPLWFSKHHYAHELAVLGYTVYFVDPVGPWRWWHLFSMRVEEEQVEDRLTVLRYHNLFPMRLWPRFFLWCNDVVNSWKLQRFMTGSSPIVWWQFDLFRFVHRPIGETIKRIYHVADPYMHHVNDKKLAQQADVVVCTSPKYVPYYQQHVRDKTILHIPHGIPTSEFEVDDNIVHLWEQRFGSFVLFVGTLNEDVDLSLLQRLLEEDITVVVAGKNPDSTHLQSGIWDALLTHSSFHFIGTVPAPKLKHLIRAASVCVTLYRLGMQKVIGARSPLKVLHYLAQCTPIVVTSDVEIEELNDKVIYLAADQDAFIRLVRSGLSGNLFVDSQAVDAYSHRHQYPTLIQQILTHV